MDILQQRSIEETWETYHKESEEYVFFYHGPLSQWWFSPFVFMNQQYLCAEQFMMAEKAALFHDFEAEDRILREEMFFTTQKEFNSLPKRCQAIGREVKNFNQSQWEQFSFKLVLLGNLAKFSAYPQLAQLLAKAGSKTFVEASPIDRVWGIGKGLQDPLLFEKHTWQGENRLGLVLTEVKNILFPELRGDK